MISLKLTPAEVVKLDGQCRPEIQVLVEQARLALSLAELPEAVAGFVSETVTEARERGKLIWRHTNIDHCRLCNKSGTYPDYKSGPRVGQRRDGSSPSCFSGVDLRDSVVSVRGHASLGGCRECVEAAAPTLRRLLRDVQAEVPEKLVTEGRLEWVKFRTVECQCGWSGHDGLLGRVFYPHGGHNAGECPQCHVQDDVLGRRPFKRDYKTHVVCVPPEQWTSHKFFTLKPRVPTVFGPPPDQPPSETE